VSECVRAHSIGRTLAAPNVIAWHEQRNTREKIVCRCNGCCWERDSCRRARF